MLDIKFIRENVNVVKTAIVNRGLKVDVDKLLIIDEQRRKLMHQGEQLRAEQKSNSKAKPSPEKLVALKKLAAELQKVEAELEQLEPQYWHLLKQVPNLIHPKAPLGGETDFEVLEKHGTPPKFDFEPKDHETLLSALDLIDFERGAKVAASKFYFFKKDMVRLNQALINYGIEVVTKHGFELVETPDVAKNQILEGIGFIPRGPETQVYSIENSDLSLIGTAEITMGGYHANEILDLSASPKKYMALSHCFRTEAGSYGKEAKGLYRVHQFTKLEMFIYCRPQESEQLHEELLSIEKEICDGLGLVYRVIDTPSGDLGAPAYRKFDIEAWMVMKNDYGEITSTSNCTDYQARRLNIRYRKTDGKMDFVHTLNGTAVVSSRFPLAIIEQFQQKDGSIKIPQVLVKYMGKEVIK
jgi:seryl-tRNA synthetase